uniref:Separase n=2 Tax=Macrostomum lignano TaxID=282301 RepID=A0A1I8FW49_9PLAT
QLPLQKLQRRKQKLWSRWLAAAVKADSTGDVESASQERRLDRLRRIAGGLLRLGDSTKLLSPLLGSANYARLTAPADYRFLSRCSHSAVLVLSTVDALHRGQTERACQLLLLYVGRGKPCPAILWRCALHLFATQSEHQLLDRFVSAIRCLPVPDRQNMLLQVQLYYFHHRQWDSLFSLFTVRDPTRQGVAASPESLQCSRLSQLYLGLAHLDAWQHRGLENRTIARSRSSTSGSTDDPLAQSNLIGCQIDEDYHLDRAEEYLSSLPDIIASWPVGLSAESDSNRATDTYDLFVRGYAVVFYVRQKQQSLQRQRNKREVRQFESLLTDYAAKFPGNPNSHRFLATELPAQLGASQGRDSKLKYEFLGNESDECLDSGVQDAKLDYVDLLRFRAKAIRARWDFALLCPDSPEALSLARDIVSQLQCLSLDSNLDSISQANAAAGAFSLAAAALDYPQFQWDHRHWTVATDALSAMQAFSDQCQSNLHSNKLRRHIKLCTYVRHWPDYQLAEWMLMSSDAVKLETDEQKISPEKQLLEKKLALWKRLQTDWLIDDDSESRDRVDEAECIIHEDILQSVIHLLSSIF